MRKLVLSCAAAVLLTGPATRPAAAFSVHPHRATHLEQREIEHAEDEVRRALMESNGALLERLLADDFLGISVNGTLTDKQQSVYRIGHKETVYTVMDVIDRKVRIQGSSAIVVSTANLNGKVEGSPVVGTFRYTRVWGRNAEGAWRLRNSEITRVTGQATGEMSNGRPVQR